MDLIEFLVPVVAASIRMSAPVLLAAYGEVFAERSGVLNLGVEGIMIVGTFTAAICSYLTNNPWIGLASAIAVSGLFSLVHAFLSVSLRASQILSGLSLSILGLSLTSFLGRAIIGTKIPGFETITTPLVNIPILGPILFQHNVLVYIALFLVIPAWIVLSRTTLGLTIKAVGENPKAADTLGVNVPRVRCLCILVGGVLAGIGGAFLSLGYVSMWVDGMTAGRGWIAIAIVYFSGWDPIKAILGALLFGGIDAFQLRLQVIRFGAPVNILAMLPYIAAIIALALIVKRRGAAGPASLGIPYIRGD